MVMSSKKMPSREFGDLIGRSESYASLLRRNLRRPSTEVINSVLAAFTVSDEDRIAMTRALESNTFGTWLEETLLTLPADDEPAASEAAG